MLQYSQGDVAAFEQLYRRHKAPLYRYFLRQTQGQQYAEELSQDVWTRIIGARHSYEPKANFTTYLYHVAHNRLVDHYRRTDKPRKLLSQDNNESVDQVPDTEQSPEQQLEQQRTRQHILRIVADLPHEQREVFVLKEDAGLSLAQISMALDENVETVKSRLRYALKKLKQALAALDDP